MSQFNPLFKEILRGLARPCPAHLAYLNYLLIQAVVLVLWWPKHTVFEMLESEKGPATLLALVMAVGMTVAYYSLRAGAEEILLPGQHSLRNLALPRLVFLECHCRIPLCSKSEDPARSRRVASAAGRKCLFVGTVWCYDFFSSRPARYASAGHEKIRATCVSVI